MSTPTGVDGDAPVRARHETDINAPLDTVWQLHADVNAWPAWQTDRPPPNPEADCGQVEQHMGRARRRR